MAQTLPIKEILLNAWREKIGDPAAHVSNFSLPKTNFRHRINQNSAPYNEFYGHWLGSHNAVKDEKKSEPNIHVLEIPFCETRDPELDEIYGYTRERDPMDWDIGRELSRELRTRIRMLLQALYVFPGLP